MFSYDGLLQKLGEKGLTRTALTTKLGISSHTVAKIRRGEKIARRTLCKVAAFLDCSVEELCQDSSQESPLENSSKPRSDLSLLQILREEKSIQLSGGVYHELQVRMTYNSNHIEGSKLSEEQTRLIFETQRVYSEGLLLDDIIETANHFRAIDYVIDHADEQLTEAVIKELHRILKQGTKDASREWFAVGDYKKLQNAVGGRETASPKDVPAKIKALLAWYERLHKGGAAVTVNDIIRFHYEFECIHPFQDGNGRVGRLIALKECLRFGIVPFIIEDAKKAFYYRGLSEWKRDKGYLTDTCLDGQDTFKRLMSLFDIKP